MSMRQAIVWIDMREAQILRVEAGIRHDSTISAPDAARLKDHPEVYFEQIASAVETAHELLVVGPTEMKHDFVKYMHKKDHGFDSRILGVETIEKPDDSQLTGYANIYFTEGGPRRSGQGSGYRETD